jgi:KDO2-lipid IV(A) lauroyltransferase
MSAASLWGYRKGNLHETLHDIMKIDSKRERQKIIRKFFGLRIKEDLDILLYPRINKSNFRSVVRIGGLQHLDNALQKGNGVILLHTHFGNPQMLIVALGYSGYSVHQIAGNPVDDLEHFLQRPMTKIEARSAKQRLECESTLPAKFIYVSQSLRGAFKCLQSNEILAIALDGGKDEKNRCYVDFLGKTAFFSGGAIKLALKTNAEVLPAFVKRDGSYRHRLIIEPPLEINLKDDSEENIRGSVQKYARILEKYVQGYPCHYLKVVLDEERRRFV